VFWREINGFQVIKTWCFTYCTKWGKLGDFGIGIEKGG